MWSVGLRNHPRRPDDTQGYFSYSTCSAAGKHRIGEVEGLEDQDLPDSRQALALPPYRPTAPM